VICIACSNRSVPVRGRRCRGIRRSFFFADIAFRVANSEDQRFKPSTIGASMQKMCLAIAVLLLLCSSTFASNSVVARVIAQDFVREKIPNPTSASFHFGATSDKVADATFRVAGKVTVVNNFGARLVKKYAATVVYDASTKKWTAKSVSVDD